MDDEISEYVLRLPFAAGALDSHRNTIDTWGLPEPVGIIAMDPGQSIDPRRPDHDRVITTPTIYAPFGTPFRHRDLCIVRGEVFHVDGNPVRWIDEDSDEIGDVIKLRRIEG